MHPLISAEQLATSLSVTPNCIRNWAKSGVLPSLRIGGTFRFDVDEVAKRIATLDDAVGDSGSVEKMVQRLLSAGAQS